MSRTAEWRIGSRGGQLWVWVAELGDSELIRNSFSRPDGVEFEFVSHNGLTLWFQRDFPIDKLKIGWTPGESFVRGHSTLAHATVVLPGRLSG